MASSYDEAVTALYQAPHDSFVAERQRLSAELKASGDKLAAARVAKLARPSISAWAVNQLWWHARPAFDELFDTASELRAGKLTARAAHRQALAKLSARARKLLTDNGHASSEGTLRRVEMTLSGLAAAGSFAPESAGALTKDRDPPGFEAFGSSSPGSDSEEGTAPSAAEREPKSKAPAQHIHELAEAKRREHIEAQRARDQAAAEKKRAAQEHAKRQAARRELETRVREAKSELAERERECARIAKALTAAEREVARAREALETAEGELGAVTEE